MSLHNAELEQFYFGNEMMKHERDDFKECSVFLLEDNA